MKRKISAEIIADSIDKYGNRITTFILTYPRFIHAEIMTHRMFSRNSASSRAIPFEKMLDMVENDPVIPIAWQKDHTGMQGSNYFTDTLDKNSAEKHWLRSLDYALITAKDLNRTVGVTKQLCNRLLEPFMWHTVIITATEYENFFDLRCPKYRMVNDSGVIERYRSKEEYLDDLSTMDFNIVKDYTIEQWMSINDSMAEIHMQTLAEEMWNAYRKGTPAMTSPGQWHIPFGDKFDPAKLPYWEEIVPNADDISKSLIKISVARCARLSYMTFEGEIDYAKDIELHDMLLRNKHSSPFEHCAKNYPLNKMYANFKGWISYRKLLEENEEL